MTCTVNTTCHRLDSGERIRNATSINLPQNKVGIDAQRSRILVNPCQQDYTRRWGYRETRKKTGGEKCTRRGYIYIYIREEGWKRYSQGFPYPPPCYRVIFSFPSPRLSFPPPPPPPLLSTTIDLFLLVNPPTCNPLLLLRSQRHVFDDNSFNEIPLLF